MNKTPSGEEILGTYQGTNFEDGISVYRNRRASGFRRLAWLALKEIFTYISESVVGPSWTSSLAVGSTWTSDTGTLGLINSEK